MKYFLLSLLLTGCASKQIAHSTASTYISSAAVTADRIDSKSVVIAEWLKSH